VVVKVLHLANSFLEGIEFVLFVGFLHIFRKKGQRSWTSLPIFVVGILLYGLATAQISLDATHAFEGFISDKNREQRIKFFTTIQHPVYISQAAVYFTAVLVGDLGNVCVY
jgi:hypothetical protein